MTIYVFISGFSGVYTEYLLKKNLSESLFKQNVYLYSYGIIFNTITILINIKNVSGFINLNDFDIYGWILIISLTANGLCMSVVMKYSNNITKLFVISSSIIVTTFLSWLIFAVEINSLLIIVYFMILFALYLYMM